MRKVFPEIDVHTIKGEGVLSATRYMTHEHDFSKGKRGRVVPPEVELQGKARITIRLDQDLLDYFLHQADLSGGATGYQTLINDALRLHVEGKGPQLKEKTGTSADERYETARLRALKLMDEGFHLDGAALINREDLHQR